MIQGRAKQPAKVSFVHDGRALTSQGGARSYDVAMPVTARIR